jgi:putative addiction module killer protein
MSLLEVIAYQTLQGKIPYQDWLQSIRDSQMRGRIRTRVDRLRLGNFGDCKSIGAGVLELRMHFGPGYRLYFAQDGQRLIVLLCGGDKSTQSRDVEKALRYWQDYKRRK